MYSWLRRVVESISFTPRPFYQRTPEADWELEKEHLASAGKLMFASFLDFLVCFPTCVFILGFYYLECFLYTIPFTFSFSASFMIYFVKFKMSSHSVAMFYAMLRAFRISLCLRSNDIILTRHAVYHNVTRGAFVQPLFKWKGIKYNIFWVCVCSLSYPQCKAHAPYWHVACPALRCFSTLSH